ncbi:MAG: hypothetical protein C0623_13775 [Desulfuromonas sp.]|nr:MAG: hypothetical protein C0623_13775 [Desulfuromonas sp.]
MNSDQRETTQIVLKPDIDPPAPLIMTTFALFSLLQAMCIIQLMTAETVGRLFFLFLPVAGVTLAASQFTVLVPQRKLRLVVIKLALLPTGGLMALLAFIAEAATMQVFRTVA